jgi:hypothetical protein
MWLTARMDQGNNDASSPSTGDHRAWATKVPIINCRTHLRIARDSNATFMCIVLQWPLRHNVFLPSAWCGARRRLVVDDDTHRRRLGPRSRRANETTAHRRIETATATATHIERPSSALSSADEDTPLPVMPGTNDADVTRRERLEIAPTAAVTTPSMLFDVTATRAGDEGDRRGGTSGGAGRLTTTAPAPSALLGKLEAFLPTMKRANDALEARVREDGGTDGVDIERVDDPDGERIEMVRLVASDC